MEACSPGHVIVAADVSICQETLFRILRTFYGKREGERAPERERQSEREKQSEREREWESVPGGT